MSIRQRKAINKFVEARGNIHISEAMRAAEYDETTIKNPKNLTESKAWKEMVEDVLVDSKVLETHRKALDAKKIVTSHTEPDYEVDDHQTQLKAVELAYKIKRRFVEGESGDKTINFFNLNDEQLDRIITGRQT